MTDERATRLATSLVFGTKNAINAFFVLPLIALGIYYLQAAQQLSKLGDHSELPIVAIVLLLGGFWCLILLYQRRKRQHGVLSELIFVLFFSQAVHQWLEPAENQAQQNIRIAYLLITSGLLLSVVKEWWDRSKETATSNLSSSSGKEGDHA